jgi:hypothetical protein
MKTKFLLLVVLAIVVVATFIAYANKPKKSTTGVTAIKSFEDCVGAGYPVLESHPRQCRLPDGTTLIEVLVDSDVSDLIKVTEPRAGVSVKSPLIVAGDARGTWYFEASFPVAIVDANGLVIAQTPAQALGEWMTENFVPFKATLTFNSAPTTKTGFIVLSKDNPSGLPEHDKELRVPIVFSQ